MTNEQRNRANSLKSDCNEAKHKLMTVQDALYSIGAVKDAEKLGAIIGRLEAWQNH